MQRHYRERMPDDDDLLATCGQLLIYIARGSDGIKREQGDFVPAGKPHDVLVSAKLVATVFTTGNARSYEQNAHDYIIAATRKQKWR